MSDAGDRVIDLATRRFWRTPNLALRAVKNAGLGDSDDGAAIGAVLNEIERELPEVLSLASADGGPRGTSVETGAGMSERLHDAMRGGGSFESLNLRGANAFKRRGEGTIQIP